MNRREAIAAAAGAVLGAALPVVPAVSNPNEMAIQCISLEQFCAERDSRVDECWYQIHEALWKIEHPKGIPLWQ